MLINPVHSLRLHQQRQGHRDNSPDSRRHPSRAATLHRPLPSQWGGNFYHISAAGVRRKHWLAVTFPAKGRHPQVCSHFRWCQTKQLAFRCSTLLHVKWCNDTTREDKRTFILICCATVWTRLWLWMEKKYETQNQFTFFLRKIFICVCCFFWFHLTVSLRYIYIWMLTCCF